MPIRGLKGGMLKFLKDEDLEAIHYATLEVLSEVGVKMEYKPALETFCAHGANVDFENSIVKIDEYLLNKALSTAPSRFTLYGKNETTDVKVDPERVYTLSLIHISEPTRRTPISYAVFCLKKKKKN